MPFELPTDPEEIIRLLKKRWKEFCNSGEGASGSFEFHVIRPGDEVGSHETAEATKWGFSGTGHRGAGVDRDGGPLHDDVSCSGSDESIQQAAREFLEDLAAQGG